MPCSPCSPDPLQGSSTSLVAGYYEAIRLLTRLRSSSSTVMPVTVTLKVPRAVPKTTDTVCGPYRPTDACASRLKSSVGLLLTHLGQTFSLVGSGGGCARLRSCDSFLYARLHGLQ